MQRYFLSILFDAEDMENLSDTDGLVILGKPSPSGAITHWCSFPFYQMNAVSWEESYALYASALNVPVGASVYLPHSPMPAQVGRKYIYDAEGGLNERPGDQPNAITVKNRIEPATDLQVLLLQNIWVNGQDYPNRPVMAATLPAGGAIEFAMGATLYIWLDFGKGSATKPSLVAYEEGQTNKTVRFDPVLQEFKS